MITTVMIKTNCQTPSKLMSNKDNIKRHTFKKTSTCFDIRTHIGQKYYKITSFKDRNRKILKCNARHYLKFPLLHAQSC